jgi:Na+-translocating ferredoxin:NAD+ oxidoreductase RnfA subunit
VLQVASRAASWLRYRRVVLPLGLEQLGDMAFDVIITSHIKQPQLHEAKVDETLKSLLTLATPGE